jgi:hypothetical protein
VYQLHPQRAKVFAGMLFYPPTALEGLVSLTGPWYEGVGEKEAMLQFLTIGPDKNVSIHMLQISRWASSDDLIFIAYDRPLCVLQRLRESEL